ncbi:response regulator [Butyricicoccus sp. Marseille-Q5471]|uniref:response regulator n=1 Tax=Butyricicoccus sp. Marseille-Q5471 TaxID=3039493 RepID=UPI0024BD3504|nr:response regulator [Butyricicoccus sp. Marseille-Q5471]
MKKLFSLMLAIVLLIGLGLPAFAAEDKKLIRVGYMGYEDFISLNQDGVLAGYGVEYFNEIAKYADVRYEYIQGTWADNLKKLENHEIDLVCTAKLTRERLEKFSFSKNSFGNVQGVLYTRPDNAEIYYEDYAAFDGKKFAFLDQSLNINLVTAYAKTHGFTFEPVFYESDLAMEAALLGGEVDVVVTEHMTKHDNLKLVGNFDSQPFYLMSYQDNDFMTQIDAAMCTIFTEDPYFRADLFTKYYGKHSAIKDPHFTRTETEYIAQLLENRKKTTGKASLKVAVFSDSNPVSYLDENGELCGIRVDLLNEISRISGIPLELVSLEEQDGTYGYEYFRDNGFDLMIVDDNAINRAYGDRKEAGMRFTQAFDNMKKVAIAENGFTPSKNKAYTIAYAASAATLPQLFASWYPNSALLPCATIEKCFEAVRDGKADMLIYNQYIAERELLRPQYDNLAVVPGVTFSDTAMISPVIFKNGSYKEIGDAAIDPYLNNPLLISVLNKAIASIDEETVNNIVIKNTIGTYSSELSVQDFIYKYKPLLIAISVAVLFILFLTVSLYLNKRKNFTRLSDVNKKLTLAVAQADAASRAKSTFLARMSHEIRTPMNAIIGITTLAKAHKKDEQQMDDYLEKISASSKVLLNIINDVLDMSAIENEKLHISNVPLDFKEVLMALCGMYYTQCKSKGVGFSMVLSEVTVETLVGDALRLNQILLNLLSNAYKFTPPGGSVKLQVIQRMIKGKHVYMRFVVSDTGCGMTEEMQQRLFRPFEQESSGTALQHGGSGLGMSITKNLVDLMHGSIRVESQKDVGTTVTVELPFGLSEEQLETSPDKFKSIRALIVDDEADTCDYTAAVLKRLGIDHDIARDGKQAIELLTAQHDKGCGYDVCFVDWKMPGLNGVDVTRKIREMFDEDAIIIIVSAYDLSEVQEEAKAAGANIFVTKPLFQSTVFNVLMTLSGGKYKQLTADKRAYDFSGHKVLLAEDNAINREIACALLEMVNMQVDCAVNGEEAVKRFEAAPAGTYAAILMDIQMPIMDGYEAAKAIRSGKHAEAATIPIFAMTANAFAEDVSTSIASGMDGHISKPIDTEILYRTLQKVLGQ